MLLWSKWWNFQVLLNCPKMHTVCIIQYTVRAGFSQRKKVEDHLFDPPTHPSPPHLPCQSGKKGTLKSRFHRGEEALTEWHWLSLFIKTLLLFSLFRIVFGSFDFCFSGFENVRNLEWTNLDFFPPVFVSSSFVCCNKYSRDAVDSNSTTAYRPFRWKKMWNCWRVLEGTMWYPFKTLTVFMMMNANGKYWKEYNYTNQ